MTMEERLQKIIAFAGIASRRAAEQLILEGRVRVNGKVVTELGTKADASIDHIKVDGKLINPQQPKVYLMLNKPLGYVTTMADPEGRPKVSDLLKGIRARVYPVGRLDYNTEGLLLLTNDGDFAHRVTHPSHELAKTYLVKVKGALEDRDVEMLEKGVFLQDGKTAPARVRRLRKEESNSWVEITIHEGRKRQVRRMIDHTGHSVIRLKRSRVGNLDLGDLPVGSYRHLTAEEVKALRDMVQGPGQPAHFVTGVPTRRTAPDWKRMEVEAIAGPAKRDRKPLKERRTADAGLRQKEGAGRRAFPARGADQRRESTRKPVEFRQRTVQRPGGKRSLQGEQRVEKTRFRARGASSPMTGPRSGERFRPRQSGSRPFDEGAQRLAHREPRSGGRRAWQGGKATGRPFEGPRRPFVKKGPRPAGGPRPGGGATDERRAGYEQTRAGLRERMEANERFSREGRGSAVGARKAWSEGPKTWQNKVRSGAPASRDTGSRSKGRMPSSAGDSRYGGRRSSGPTAGWGRAVKDRSSRGRGPRRG
jgi:23S rRNA pseudouridine2605 synthase